MRDRGGQDWVVRSPRHIASERAEFLETGIVGLAHLVPKAKVDAARDSVFRELARLRMRENGKWHTRKFDGVPPFQVAARLAQAISHQPSFDDVIPKELVASLGELAGHTLRPGSACPQILVTPPQKEPWRIPENGWHVDLSASSSGRLPGIQVFVLLDDVAPHGGGTLALRGSHLSRGVTPDPERLVEMAGKAGDVYLMDMRTLHAPSINATRKARIMLTSRFVDAISIA